jgi:hypothetical protein
MFGATSPGWATAGRPPGDRQTRTRAPAHRTARIGSPSAGAAAADTRDTVRASRSPACLFSRVDSPDRSEARVGGSGAVQLTDGGRKPGQVDDLGPQLVKPVDSWAIPPGAAARRPSVRHPVGTAMPLSACRPRWRRPRPASAASPIRCAWWVGRDTLYSRRGIACPRAFRAFGFRPDPGGRTGRGGPDNVADGLRLAMNGR